MDKKLDKMKRKAVLDLDDDDDDDGDTNTDDEESKEDKKNIKAYIAYATEVMSTIIFYIDPNVNLEQTLPNIQKAARMVIRISKKMYKVRLQIDFNPNHILIFDGNKQIFS